MLKLEHLHKTFHPGTANENHVIRDLSLTLNEGDFVTVIGSNGAGKSTILNLIAGVETPDSGHISIENKDLTYTAEHKRARYLGRVFQDPLTGTAGDMMIEENLAMAARRGKRRNLSWGITADERAHYHDLLAGLNLGLEGRMSQKVRRLSGGQRQALTLLMATLKKPSVLLLDEHTAALDPKTAITVLELTEKLVAANHLTTLMITHNMRDAIRYGNRLVMMDSGRIIYDISGEEKQKLSVTDLLHLFEKAAGEELSSDSMILSV